MHTVAEIVAAAAQLTPDEFLDLRRELNRLELRLWEKDLTEATTRTEPVVERQSKDNEEE